MFNLAIDSKLRACDLIALKIEDVSTGGRVRDRASVMQRKTSSVVHFEIGCRTKASLEQWLALTARNCGFLFPSRRDATCHLSVRQYARIVDAWIKSAGLEKSLYATHTLRRTKATILYRKTGNLRAVQLLLGHKSIENTIRYLGVEVDDALELSGLVEI
jgi:integrase